MKDIEKKIVERLGSAESSGAVDADELWGNILPELPSEEPPKAIPPRPWPIYLLSGLVLILGLGLIILATRESKVLQTINSFPVQETQKTSSQNPSEKMGTTTKELTDNKVTDAVIKEAQSEDHQAFQSAKIKIPRLIEKQNNNLVANTTTPYIRNESSLTQKAEDKLKVPQIAPTTQLPDPDDFADGSTNRVIANETKSPPTAASSAVNNLPALPILPLQPAQFSKQPNILPLPNPAIEEEISGFSRNRQKRFEVSLQAGVLSSIPRFSAPTSGAESRTEVLNKAFQLEPGFTLQTELAYQIGQAIRISTGLHFNQTVQEFNYYSEVDTTVMVFNGQDSILRSAIRSHSVIHHNKFTALSVPLLLGYRFTKEKLSLELQAGIGLNFSLNQTGRSLNANGQIFDYNENTASDLLPRSSFSISYLMRLGVVRQLNDRWSVNLRANVGYTPEGLRPVHDLNVSTFRGGFTTGLGYRF